MAKRTQHVRKSTGKSKTKMKMYTTREARRIAERNGYELVRVKGDHWIYKHPNHSKILTISEGLNRMVWERCVREFNLNLNVSKGVIVMTLRQMLSIVDFDYEITEENQIALIDRQGANYGGIEQERWDITDDVCMQIIDRLDIYFTDCIYDDIIEECKDCFDDKDPFDGDWKLMWLWLLDTEREKIPNTISKFEMSMVYYILNPEDLIIEEMVKE